MMLRLRILTSPRLANAFFCVGLGNKIGHLAHCHNQWMQVSVRTPSTGLRHPSTTAVFSYVIGSRKLSANEQFFVGAQTVVSLLQTTQINSDVYFITDHVAYASSVKTKIV